MPLDALSDATGVGGLELDALSDTSAINPELSSVAKFKEMRSK